MMTGNLFLSGAGQIAMAMLLAAMVMLLWRLAKGPGAADRVIALDLLSVLVVAFLVILSIHTGKSTYLDVAIAYACIAFLGTIALVRFIHKSGRKSGLHPPQSAPDSTKGGSDD
ncbi:cation:proton antiporter [Desulfobacula sp.]|uniref:cation:proton antiporter n=1 Tax=Desulfobacula sp. TaxID=2593537 RepID=UPI002616E3E3|nr:cation:proton antiporter [Desulfobacula sp.]